MTIQKFWTEEEKDIFRISPTNAMDGIDSAAKLVRNEIPVPETSISLCDSTKKESDSAKSHQKEIEFELMRLKLLKDLNISDSESIKNATISMRSEIKEIS